MTNITMTIEKQALRRVSFSFFKAGVLHNRSESLGATIGRLPNNWTCKVLLSPSTSASLY